MKAMETTRMGGNTDGRIATPDIPNKTALPGADSDPCFLQRGHQ